MNIQTIKTGAKIFSGKSIRFGKAHGPSILVGAGILGMAVTTYRAVKESETAQIELDTIEYNLANAKNTKEKAIVYANGTKNLAYNYKTTLLGFTLSTTAILTGYSIMKKRYLGATMAITVLSKQFDTYRKACIEENGVAADHRYMNGLTKKKMDVIDENGKKKKEDCLVDTNGIDENFSYCRYFDDEEAGSVYDKKNKTMNIAIINMANTTLNETLKARGHVLLNDAYEALGLTRTYAGGVTGWLSRAFYENVLESEYWASADNYINITYDIVKKFDKETGEYKDSILLDFNVDGVVIDKINLSPFYKAPEYLQMPLAER